MPRNVLVRCVAAIIVGPAPPHVLKDDEEKKQVMHTFLTNLNILLSTLCEFLQNMQKDYFYV